MAAITRFRDIPEFTRSGSYEIDVEPRTLAWQLSSFASGCPAGIDLNPDFQRGHVWTHKQRVAYLEFFLRGGFTARVVYFNCPSWHREATTPYDDFVLVDGKQRLEAWRLFLVDTIKVFGSYYCDFKDKIRTRHSLRFNVNDLQTKDEVLQWYLDYNTGGVVHTESELARVRKLLKKSQTRK